MQRRTEIFIPRCYKGESGVYKSGLLTDEDENVIMDLYPGIDTLWDAFNRGMKILQDSQNVASALIGDFELKPGDRIGIYSQNRPEWLICALACIQQSIVVVPLYDTLGADAAAFIVSAADISVVIVDKMTKARSLASKKNAMVALKTIVMVEKHDVSEVEEVRLPLV
ncbi:hypothetical protein NECAME_03118 [Necator americanus]|uniref:long-chain-fatty-acid--CoA ligase n=1 Tax=Necator americanus TaxID=51031 RepID=W2T6R4_NECAM|nr:hypothetical protein NECAME_03118 [Necator americanus]ETN77700.1 hypothetical protein NECAME_03118 [Necator americanus]